MRLAIAAVCLVAAVAYAQTPCPAESECIPEVNCLLSEGCVCSGSQPDQVPLEDRPQVLTDSKAELIA